MWYDFVHHLFTIWPWEATERGEGRVRDGSVGVTHLTIVTRAVSLPLSFCCVCVYSISTGGSIFVFVSPSLVCFVCFNLLMSRHPRLYIEKKSWFFYFALFFRLLIVIFELFLKIPPCFWLKNELEKNEKNKKKKIRMMCRIERRTCFFLFMGRRCS